MQKVLWNTSFFFMNFPSYEVTNPIALLTWYGSTIVEYPTDERRMFSSSFEGGDEGSIVHLQVDIDGVSYTHNN